MTLLQTQNVFIYTLLGERKRKGMGFCGCHKEIKARIPQLLADMKKRKLFKTLENTKCPGLCSMVGLFLFLQGNTKASIRILCCVYYMYG